MTSKPTLTVIVSTQDDGSLVLTTWGIRGGRYGSLGRVVVAGPQEEPPVDTQQLAVLVLTALYGMDYAL